MTINEDAAREAIGAVLRNRVLFIGDTSTRYSGVPGLLIDEIVSALKALPEEGGELDIPRIVSAAENNILKDIIKHCERRINPPEAKEET